MPISVGTVRIGKRYILHNYSETHEFKVMSAVGRNDFLCKDLTSLDEYLLSELTAYGKSKDYDFYGLDD
jgi:hypothetical protein